MVLQMGPAKAAVYGLLGAGGSSVTVTLTSSTGATSTVAAVINATTQPFGAEYGPRPHDTYSPWDAPVPMWKALLPPTSAGEGFTVTASCSGCDGISEVTIKNVAFGDMCKSSCGVAVQFLLAHTKFLHHDSVCSLLY